MVQNIKEAKIIEYNPKNLILPKVYTNDIEDSCSGNYPQHKGKPKLSYSQYTSWIDKKYHVGYRQQYFSGIKDEGNPYSKFGGQVGEYFETGKVGDMLSKDDVEILNKVNRDINAKYEVEIVIDRGWYVIQGFIDYEVFLQTKDSLKIIDFKTGSIQTKADFYGGDDYQQTTLYSYQRVQEGNDIDYSGVLLLDRGGNTYKGIPLHLTGKTLEIETPYSEERAQKILKKMDIVAEEIAFAYKNYTELLKIF